MYPFADISMLKNRPIYLHDALAQYRGPLYGQGVMALVRRRFRGPEQKEKIARFKHHNEHPATLEFTKWP